MILILLFDITPLGHRKDGGLAVFKGGADLLNDLLSPSPQWPSEEKGPDVLLYYDFFSSSLCATRSLGQRGLLSVNFCDGGFHDDLGL